MDTIEDESTELPASDNNLRRSFLKIPVLRKVISFAPVRNPPPVQTTKPPLKIVLIKTTKPPKKIKSVSPTKSPPKSQPVKIKEETAQPTHNSKNSTKSNSENAITADKDKPNSSGSSAFHIIAQQVYIINPSILQDPDIFGRFSIPQTLNLDKNFPQTLNSNKNFPQMLPRGNPPYPLRRSMSGNESAGGLNSKILPMNKKLDETSENPVSIASNLNGEIIVQNQDVNEYVLGNKPSD